MEAVVQRAALILAVIVALGACAPGRDVYGRPHATLADLRSEVEHTLLPPGAVVITVLGRNGYQNITGYETAFTGHRFRTASRYAEVARYYHDELTKLGWLPDGGLLLTVRDEEGRAWCRAGRRFGLSVRSALQDGEFVYTATVGDNERPCPDLFDIPSPSPAPTAPPRGSGQGLP